MKKKIAIIGAGIAGLTIANFMKINSNFEFMVYEKEDSLPLDKGFGISFRSQYCLGLDLSLLKQSFGVAGNPILSPCIETTSPSVPSLDITIMLYFSLTPYSHDLALFLVVRTFLGTTSLSNVYRLF